jgi:hypothetical protein
MIPYLSLWQKLWCRLFHWRCFEQYQWPHFVLWRCKKCGYEGVVDD